MTVLLLAAALVTATGAVATLAASDSRLGLVGLTASLVAAAFVAAPLPDPAVLAVRLTGALLAVAILRAIDGYATSAAGPIDGSGLVRRDPAGRLRGWSGSADAGVDSRRGGLEPHLGWLPVAAIAAAGLAAGLSIGARLDVVTASSAAAAGASGSSAVGIGPGDLATELGSAAGLSIGLAALLIAIAAGPALVGSIGLRRAMACLLVVEGIDLIRLGLTTTATVAEEVVAALMLVTVAGAATALAVRRPAPDEADEPVVET